MTTTLSEIDGVAARERVTPGSAEELAAALRAFDEAGHAVAPVGGGTQLELGNPPGRLDYLLDTTRLDRVVEYEPADLTVTVEAGMRFDALQRLLGAQSQFLALDPPALEGATIGGLIATNASGPLRFSSGTARDLVIGCRVANPDGALTRAGGRVVKNVAGYDLNKLYIGSLGVLGVLVELSFKLAPLPPATGCVIGSFAGAVDARQLLREVVRSPLTPLAVELVSPAFARLSGLPEQWHVVFRAGGYPSAVERQVRELSALVTSHGGTSASAPEAWDALAAQRAAAQGRPVVVKASAPLSRSAELAELLSSGLERAAVWAHAGNGVAYAACDGVEAGTLRELRRSVGALGENASLVIQRCPIALKRELDVWGETTGSVALMRALKAKLDPRGTLNPGRYVGGI